MAYLALKPMKLPDRQVTVGDRVHEADQWGNAFAYVRCGLLCQVSDEKTEKVSAALAAGMDVDIKDVPGSDPMHVHMSRHWITKAAETHPTSSSSSEVVAPVSSDDGQADSLGDRLAVILREGLE